jgi:PAS domain S-box-containing protein
MTGSAPLRDPARRAAPAGAAVQAALLTALAYAAAGRLGLMLAIPPGYATLVWPPAGIALAAAVRLGRPGLAGVALGSFAVNCAASAGGWSLATLALPAAIAAASTAQAALGAWALRRCNAYPYAAATPLSVARFFALGALACVIAATLGNLALCGFGVAPMAQFLRGWATWWGGDFAGVVAFAPALLAFEGPSAGARWRRAAPIVSAALSAFAATFALVFVDAAAVQRGVKGDFELLARDLASRLEATVDLGQHAVEGLAGEFSTAHERDLADFQTLAHKLAAFGLGIQALEWIPQAPAAELAGFESEMSRQWGRPYQVFERREGKPVPVAPRPVYFPVGFATPFKGNEAAVGFDLASNPAREAALVKARDSGGAVATAGLKLVQNNAMGILLFTPVYAPGLPAGSPEQRRAALKGFALGVFSAPDLLGVALSASDAQRLDYWLIDETDAGAPTVLAANSAAPPHDFELSSSSLFAAPTTLGAHFSIRVADRRWLFRLAPTAAYVARRSEASPYWLLVGGLALTAFGVAYVLVLTARQHRLFDSRERDLRNQKFALDQHAIVSMTDPRGVIVYANDRFCDISGHAREKLIGANHNLVRSGRHDEAFYAQLWGTIGAGAVWRGEICNRNAAGELYWINATIVPLTGRQGEIENFIAICTDITARKRLEQDLENSRAFLQSVTESIGEGLYALDERGRCTFLNAEAERLLGWSFEEMRGRCLHDVVHFQDAAGAPICACDCAIMMTLRDGSKVRTEDQVFTHRDGRIFPVSTVAVRLERAGNPAGAVVVFQDITERRRVLQELQESEQRLSFALRASSTGLWDVDPIHDRVFYSDTWFRMLGYEPSAGEHNGATFFSLLHPEDLPAYGETMRRHESGATATVEVEFRMRRADGEWAWIRSIGKIIARDAAGKPTRLIGVHIDATAAHRAQAELAAAKDAAVRANQAKSEFLATMSHEIRTPMNAIIGLSHLFARTPMNARQHDYLAKIQNASQALLGVINDILDFSKIEAGKLTLEAVEFELDKAVDDVVDVISPKAAEKGLALVVERAPGAPGHFVGDPLRLSQILTNLLSNAVKFTCRGEVRVTLGGEPLPDGRFRLVVSVADNGIGMSEAQMALLFRPFAQADASTSRRFGGTGLGLAICRQIVGLMDGDITVSSVEGAGATFTFRLPLKVGAAAQLAERERQALAGRRALLVEDSKSSRHMLRAALADWGVEAAEAATGLEALQRVAEGPAFDLVLIDWKLPDIDGVEVLARLRAAGPAPAALMLTAYGGRALAEALSLRFAAAAPGVLEKPYSPRQLKQRVLAALGEEGAASAEPDRRASDVLLPDARILLVEDNSVNQQVATELLEALGVEVTLAASGDEALEILAQRRFDLILMDVQMPGRDGLETTDVIRNEFGDARTPIVAMTANAMAGDRERCLEAGMNDHIAKPIDPDKLALTLARWLSGRLQAPARRMETAPRETGRLSGVDVEAALRNLGGNAELFEQLLDIFVDEHREAAGRLAQAAAEGAWKRVNALAHALKGAASTLGALDVAEIARGVEQAAREPAPDAEAIGRATQALGAAIGLVVDAVAARRRDAPPAAPPTRQAAPPAAAELTPILDQLKRLLEAGDADAETESERLAAMLAETAAAMRAAEVARCAGRYDFDAAAEALAELRREVAHWSQGASP